MVVMEAEGYNVQPDRNFIARVEELCGRGAVRVIDSISRGAKRVGPPPYAIDQVDPTGPEISRNEDCSR